MSRLDRRPTRVAAQILLVLLLAGSVPAQEAGEEAEGPETHVARKGPFRVALVLDGVFEAGEARELGVRLEEWTELEVLEAVGHGRRVNEGDVLLRLDTRKLDQSIEDLATEFEIARIDLQKLAEEVRALEQSVPIELAALERSDRIAREDLARFLAVDRPLAEKGAAFSLKSAQNQLAYELEELEQLQKMYQADDLTEETEEIILKRQKDVVEIYQHHLESTRAEADATARIELPRQQEDLEKAVLDAAIALEKGRIELPSELEKKRLEKAKSERTIARDAEKLERLRRDREKMSVASPSAGIVYYGRATHGAWPDAKTLEESLRPGGEITSGTVVLSVVAPAPLSFRATVPEESLRWVQAGLEGWVVAKGHPGRRIAAAVESVTDVPVAPGVFEARISVRPGQDDPLLPGLAGQVRLVPYRTKEAIVVPAKGVFVDDFTDGGDSVYVAGADGSSERRPVRVGARDGEWVEILEGLSEGETILLEEPR